MSVEYENELFVSTQSNLHMMKILKYVYFNFFNALHQIEAVFKLHFKTNPRGL